MAIFASGKDFDQIEYGPDNEDDWFVRDKPKLTMTLPNLPYLRDGSLEISEHDAIFRHVLRKYKPELLGNTIDEQAEVDQFISWWSKTNMDIRNYCYSAKDHTDEQRKAKLDGFKAQLTRIDERLASRKFTMGDHITGADIFLYDSFWMMSVVHPETAHSYQNIHRVFKEIENLEWFKAYKASSKWHTQLNYHEAFINNMQ
jgi:glutathione S-transferase